MIIGLIGNKRVGKSTFGDYITEKYGFKSIAFADPIKEGAKIMFDLTNEQVNGDLKEVVDTRWNKSPRQILQILGTDACRKLFEPDIWIKRLKIELKKNKNKNVVVSDVRFPNEAKAVKEMGGILIKITKSDLVGKDSHISEQLVDKINHDILIKNDSSIEDYKQNIDNLINL